MELQQYDTKGYYKSAKGLKLYLVRMIMFSDLKCLQKRLENFHLSCDFYQILIEYEGALTDKLA